MRSPARANEPQATEVTASARVAATGMNRSSVAISSTRFAGCDGATSTSSAAGLGDAALRADEGPQRGGVDERALGQLDHDEVRPTATARARRRRSSTFERSKSPATWMTATTFRCLGRQASARRPAHGRQRSRSLSRTPSSVAANRGRRPIRSPHYGHMTDTILLTVPSGLRGAGVVALVLGGLGSRLDLPVDRIDELALAAATLAPSVAGRRARARGGRPRRPARRPDRPARGRDREPMRRCAASSTPSSTAWPAIRRDDHEWLELELVRSEAG